MGPILPHGYTSPIMMETCQELPWSCLYAQTDTDAEKVMLVSHRLTLQMVIWGARILPYAFGNDSAY